MRLGEALRLKWDDIKTNGDGYIIIKSTNIQPTKGKKTREIPLFKGAAEALQEFERRKYHDVFIFPRVTEKFISTYAIKEISRAGLVGSCHMLRHTFGTILCQFGANLEDVRLSLGHTKLSVTQQYLHGDPTNIKNQFDLNI
jgi:integrase